MTHDSRPDNGEIIIYQSDDGKINLDVRLENKTVWLTQDRDIRDERSINKKGEEQHALFPSLFDCKSRSVKYA